MSGPKRNADSMNTIGIVVVGICGAVMVYVTITALQAFYMNDTSEIQTMADYGGQDTSAKSHRADEMGHITKPDVGTNDKEPKIIPIDQAIDLVIADANDKTKGPTRLVPAIQKSEWKPVASEVAQPGPPVLLAAPAAPAAPAAGGGSGAGSANPATGSGATAAEGSGATPVLHTTGSPADGGGGGVGGAGGAPAGTTAGSGSMAPGGHAP